MGRGRLPVAPASRARYYYTTCGTVVYHVLPSQQELSFPVWQEPRLAPGTHLPFQDPNLLEKFCFESLETENIARHKSTHTTDTSK